jgi:hypothetical protein
MAWIGRATATLLAGGAVGALLLSACGHATSADGAATPRRDAEPTHHAGVRPTRYVSETTTYEPQDVDSAVAATLDGLDRDLFADLYLGNPRCTDSCDGSWVFASVRLAPGEAAGVGGAALPSLWQADLAQGAIAERIAGDAFDLHDVVSGSDVTLRFEDGTTEDLGGGAGDIQPGQLFAAQATGESDTSIVADVETALREYGLAPTTVRVLHPLGPAVYAQARVEDVNTIGGDWSAIQSAILGDPYRYEGLYLEIDGLDGQALARGATSYRSGSGRVWFEPGMDSVLGIAHGAAPT